MILVQGLGFGDLGSRAQCLSSILCSVQNSCKSQVSRPSQAQHRGGCLVFFRLLRSMVLYVCGHRQDTPMRKNSDSLFPESLASASSALTSSSL